MEPELRQLRSADIPAVIRLHFAALRAIGADAGPGPWDDDLNDIAGVYLQGGGEFLVATLGGTIIGMSALRRVDARTAEIKRMRVARDWQGRGLGRRLLVELESRAAALGYTRLILDTTERQPAALALYGSAGFRVTGTAVIAGLTSITMEKTAGTRGIKPARPSGRITS